MRQTSRGLPLEIAPTQASIPSLDRSLGQLASLLTAALRISAENQGGRRRLHLTAKARASLVLQGRYMGYMRQLKPRQKAQVRKVKEAKGVRAAIAKVRGLVATAR